jgi:hypothetical protein
MSWRLEVGRWKLEDGNNNHREHRGHGGNAQRIHRTSNRDF